MSQGAVIRDFMVALGFQTDNAGLAKMQEGLKGVEFSAASLNKALGALAIGAVLAVRQTAGELDKLYFSSQRIGASAGNINAFGNAVSQMGGNAEAALGTLENLAEKMRNSPGYSGQLNSLGVQTKEANGEIRDRVEVMKDLSVVLGKMPDYQANAYANSLGIDQHTLLAMKDGKFISNMEKYQQLQKDMGMNDELTKSGNDFMSEYRDLTMVTKTGFQVIVMQAGKALIPILKGLNVMIQAGIHAFGQLNPQIKEGLTVGLRFILLAGVFKVVLGVFGMINKVIPLVLGLTKGLKLLRLAFLASPIGIILALASALALLYDDYKTWKEGGKSLFDWSKWTNGIDKIISKIKYFLDILNKVKDKVVNFIQKVLTDPMGAIKEVGEAAAAGVVELAKGAGKAKDAIVNSEPVKQVTKWVDDFIEVDKLKPNSTPQNINPLADTPKQVQHVSQNQVNASKAPIPKDTHKIIPLPQSMQTAKIEAIDHLLTVAKTAQIGVNAVVPSNSEYEFSFGKDVDGYIKEAATKYGIDEKILRGFVKMEAGWTGAMSPTGAIGTGQFTQGTWNGLAKTDEGKAIGMIPITKANFRTPDDPRRDKRINTLATALLAKNNMAVLKGYGISGAGENLYMAHNIGPETFALALTGKANAAGLDAMRKNGMKKGETPRQFADRQRKIFMQHYNQANKPKAQNITSANYSEDKGFNVPVIKNYSAPLGNPNREQVNKQTLTASNVTIYQSFKTDMTLNGVSSPVDSAAAVKRQNENSMAIMIRGAQGVLV